MGPDFQITDALPSGRPTKVDEDRSAEVWNPDRISSDDLGKKSINFLISTMCRLDRYFANLKLLWPYHLYKYSEDHALKYLVRKNYDIELALTTLVVNIDDLVVDLKAFDLKMVEAFKKSQHTYVRISARQPEE